jgi:predicted TIM-barrel fold metal-dependent hydrolase
MRSGFRIIDADRHVTEPIEMWARWLEPEFRAHAPSYQLPADLGGLFPRAAHLVPRPMVQGEPIWNKVSDLYLEEAIRSGMQRRDSTLPGGDPHAQLAEMDRTNVDIAFLLPTTTMFLLGIDTLDPALAGAFARAYNGWLHEFCAVDPARLRAVGVINLHAPEQMVPELERIVSFGWTAVALRPNPIQGRTLADSAYKPFWTACEQRGIAVVIHEGTHARSPSAGADRFSTRFALHACSHPMEQMMAFLALLEGGVLERHPGLRFAFLEAGCGWLPYWLWRLDEVEFKHCGAEVSVHVRRRPSEYFRRQCFVAIEPGEPYLPELLRYLGEDNLLFGTDFPHLDHESDIVEQVLALRGALPEDVLRKLLWDNPARFYGVQGESAPSGAAPG